MDFDIPADLQAYLAELDAFIEKEIKPLERENDNIRFAIGANGRVPTSSEGGCRGSSGRSSSTRCGCGPTGPAIFRYALPKEYGGKDGSNLAMAIIREHLAAKSLGLHNDLQNESSIVGNLPTVVMFRDFGAKEQKDEFIPRILDGSIIVAFGLTEPEHGSDATWTDTHAARSGDVWRITGAKMWNTGLHVATHDFVFARTRAKPGDANGITCFIVPTKSEGFKVEEYLWTFNMPTDHPRVSLNDVVVPADAILGDPEDGLAVAQHFVHENRIRQAASSLGAAQYCINEAVKYAKERKPFGRPLAANQAIQWPLVELHTEAAMLRTLIHKTACEMDRMSKPDVARKISDKVAMCNYRANRLRCSRSRHAGARGDRLLAAQAASSTSTYRITEGSEEIQITGSRSTCSGSSARREERSNPVGRPRRANDDPTPYSASCDARSAANRTS